MSDATDTGEDRGRDGRWHRGMLAIVLLAATALRLYALGRESYWIDEIYSITDALNFSTVELVTVLPLVKNHTPVYYILLRHWAGVAGLSEAALRLPSALAGVGAVYGLYLVGTELFDRRTGLLAAGLIALSQFHVDHSQEVRMYSFLALLTAWSFYWFLKLRRQYGRQAVVGYVLTTALLVYTHPYGVFVAGAQTVFVCGRLLWKRSLTEPVAAADAITPRRWVRVQAALGALLVPYGLVAVEKIVSTAAGTYTPLTWRTPPGPTRLAETLVRHFGLEPRPLTLALAVPLFCGAIAIAGFRIWQTEGHPREWIAVRPDDRDGVALSLCWLVVPIAVPAVLSHLLAPVYGIRYTIGASLGLFLLVARTITRVRPRVLQYALVLALLVAVASPLPGYYAATDNEQWREATTHVTAAADEGDLVLFTDRAGKLAWQVYGTRSDLTVREAGTDDRWAQLEGSLSTYETIWVINRTYPATNNNRAAAAILADSHRRAASQEFVGVELYRFERQVTDATTAKRHRQSSGPGVTAFRTSVARTRLSARYHPQ